MAVGLSLRVLARGFPPITLAEWLQKRATALQRSLVHVPNRQRSKIPPPEEMEPAQRQAVWPNLNPKSDGSRIPTDSNLAHKSARDNGASLSQHHGKTKARMRSILGLWKHLQRQVQ